jgi:hypothetical protein
VDIRGQQGDPEPFPPSEERDDVHHQSANRANSMNAAVIAKNGNLTCRSRRSAIRPARTEQSRPGLKVVASVTRAEWIGR